MKSLTFVHVEGSRVDYTKSFEFDKCTVNIAKSGNTFSFDNHVMKSAGREKLENFIFADKNDNVYLIGRELCEKEEILLVDLSGISNEQISQAMDKTTNYVNGFVSTRERWSVSFPVGHEFCIFREMGTAPALCKHESNVFKLCDVGLCPIKSNTE